MDMKAKVWFGTVVAGTLSLLAVIAGYIVVVDPFFHYHKPLEGFAYELANERYQNDGIVKHFSYDTVITGTSMTANFKTTDCDAFFGGKSIKVPFHGGSFKEVNDNLKVALAYNPNVVRVIRCLDINNFTQDKDYVNYENLPEYLYDDNIFNDTQYVWNKTALMVADDILINTAAGEQWTTFDEYMNWSDDYQYGREAVLATYVRPGKEEHAEKLTDMERERTLGNVRQNITDLAKQYPDVEFDYYLSPYSICWWDVEVVQPGKLSWQRDLDQTVIEEILTCDNIHLYSYMDNFELICNLDNYKDRIHYGGETNTNLLRWMSEDKGRITKANYHEYLDRVYDYYGEYDYDSLY